MRKLFTILFVFAAFSCNAQMKTLFFDANTSAINSLVDSVKLPLHNYKTDTMYVGKSVQNFTIILSNKNADKVVISLSHYKGKIYLCNITGTPDAMLTLYQYYFAKVKEFNTCAPILLQPLKDSRKLPIAFCSNGASYTISSRTPY